MANMMRYRVGWQNALGNEGVTTFNFGDGLATDSLTAQGAVNAIAAFFVDLQTLFPDETTLTFGTEYVVIDVEDGELVAVDNIATAPGVVAGTANTVYAAGVGIRVVWTTQGIRNNRRVRGSTFLVPVVSGAFQVDGTISDTTVTVIQDAAEELIDQMNTVSAPLQVWSAPREASPGVINPVQGARVPDMPSWLRTRRT